MFDYQKVWMLLEIVHKAATLGPDGAWFATQAMAELNKVKEEVLGMLKPVQPSVGQVDAVVEGQVRRIPAAEEDHHE